MSDIFSREVRSKIMAKIKKTNSKPELIVRKFLYHIGFRYRINAKKILGCPDIVIIRINTIIFVNGCFWHAHKNCKYNKTPKTNANYWISKIKGNAERDKSNLRELKRLGWNVITIWECELDKSKIENTFIELSNQLNSMRHN